MLADQDVKKIFVKLSRTYPNPQSELKSKNNFTFLVSVVLSAQAIDVSLTMPQKISLKMLKPQRA